jgi:hypothetical protein
MSTSDDLITAGYLIALAICYALGFVAGRLR